MALSLYCLFYFFGKRATYIKFVGLNFLYQIIGYFSVGIFDLKGMDVNAPGNIQILFSFLTISVVYHIQFQKGYARFFLIMAGVFTAFALLNVFFIQRTYFNSYMASIANFIVILYCVTYFYRLLADPPAKLLRRMPMFWISAGLLVENAGAFFLFLFTPFLTKFFFDDMLIYWTFLDLLVIVGLIFVIIGVSLDFRNLTNLSSKNLS